MSVTQDVVENPVSDLTGFQRDLLVAIGTLDARPSGQDVKNRIEEIGGHGDINHGRLYPNLDALVAEDYVSKGELDRRTNYYELSDRGENARDAYETFVGL